MLLAWTTIVLLTIATGTALWSSTGTSHPVRAAKQVKAALAATFTGLQVADLYTFDLPTWIKIARTFQIVAIILVWILPDVTSKIGQARIVARIDAMVDDITGEHPVTPGGGTS